MIACEKKTTHTFVPATTYSIPVLVCIFCHNRVDGPNMENQGACHRVSVGTIGAPRYNMEREQLEMLLNMRISLSEIARSGILGTTCRQTIYNHCKRLNVELPRSRYSNISDQRLLEVVREINKEQPNSGSEEVRATLAATRGLVVHRQRVRSALTRADPVGCASRWAQTTQRRTYSVASPNSLWHLDNNHSLRR